VRVERTYIKDRPKVDPDYAARLQRWCRAPSRSSEWNGRNSAVRCPFLKSQMRTFLMMVANELGH
jgi:hypothetical protein